jgi:amidase
MNDLFEQSAVELRQMIGRGEVSSVEVVAASLARIAEVNPSVNAIVTLVPERALVEAHAADRARARGEQRGPLDGLPIAIKDLVDTAGIRTTHGSPLYEDHVPETDAALVRRLRAAGAIVVGKTNTPEFGAGSQTFNPVFGATRNPYDLSRTAGGSSGGAAAAVATGMLPFADGSDLGGSLRNPASFCNVVGLRPTPGRVPEPERADLWDPLSVSGPIARTVADAALLLGALSAPEADTPLSIGAWSDPVAAPDVRGQRVAWSRDLGGLPVDPAVTAALEGARPILEELGCVVAPAEPDLEDADEAFHVLRALGFVRSLSAELRADRGALKDTIVWNVEEGLALDAERIARAQSLRSALFRRMAVFLRTYDVLALPASLVPPFPVEQEWVHEIDGVRQQTYLDWMRACTRISVTAHPAISVPFAFTPDGLPVGLQLVGRYGDERGLLRLAAAIETTAEAWRRRPPVHVRPTAAAGSEG